MAPTIDELVLADEPDRWRALGFELEGDDGVRLGSVRVRLAGDGARSGSAPAFLGWSLRDLSTSELDGLPTTRANGASATPATPASEGGRSGQHPNAITAIDHVVAMTPALDRTVAALRAAGLDLRRIREEPTPAGAPRQAFFRLGDEILEVVQEPHEIIAREGGAGRPARLWGLALLSSDLDRTVRALGEHAGEARAAVQSGRRIATVRRSAGLAVPVAVMSARGAG
jgi:catechol 2,3-dioxygenase-like lactoylglutathione lyase family enzyme